MKPKKTALDYPVVIRKNLDFIEISIPDIGPQVIINPPIGGVLSQKFLFEIAKAVGKVWLMSQSALKEPVNKTYKFTSTKEVVKQKPKMLKIKEATKRLGISENTLRRSGIPCEITPGGHRRYDPLIIEAYREYLISQEKDDKIPPSNLDI